MIKVKDVVKKEVEVEKMGEEENECGENSRKKRWKGKNKRLWLKKLYVKKNESEM